MPEGTDNIELDVEAQAPVSMAKAAILGACSGVLSGLFGVGGGVVIVPGLVLWLGLHQRRAAATSLAAVVPISAAGLIGYSIGGEVDWVVGTLLAVSSVGGSVAGTWLLTHLPERALSWAFAALLVVVAFRLFFSDPAALGRSPLGAATVVGLVVLGLFTGVLSGLFGVGGGFVIVPGLVLGFGSTPALAKGSSLLAILPTALTSSARNTRVGLVDWRAAAGVGLVGVFTSFGASQLGVRLDPALANRAFAVLLIFSAYRLAQRARRL